MPFDSTLMTDRYKDWLIRLRSGMVVGVSTLGLVVKVVHSRESQ